MDSESENSVVDLVSSADEEAVVDVLVSTMMKDSAKRVSGWLLDNMVWCEMRDILFREGVKMAVYPICEQKMTLIWGISKWFHGIPSWLIVECKYACVHG